MNYKIPVTFSYQQDKSISKQELYQILDNDKLFNLIVGRGLRAKHISDEDLANKFLMLETTYLGIQWLVDEIVKEISEYKPKLYIEEVLRTQPMTKIPSNVPSNILWEWQDKVNNSWSDNTHWDRIIGTAAGFSNPYMDKH